MRDDGYMTEPMSIMLLSALAKKKGWVCALALLDRDDIVEKVRREKPDVVAFSVITGSHQAFLSANADIKRECPHVKTVIGGPYATFRPTVINEHPFDALGVGECDDAWPDLLDAFEGGRSIDDIHNIVTPGNVSRVLKRSLTDENGWVIVSDHLRPRKTDLDDLPFMDREIVYANTAFRMRPKRTMMAGRGCPFRCTYCFEHAWNAMYRGKGKIFQKMSVPRLVAELKQLMRDWDTRYVKWYDDVFPIVDEEWLEEFSEVYAREIGLPFHCLVRAEMVTERRLNLLKKAGIMSLSMSIEAGNPFVRDYVLIRKQLDEDIRQAFALCRKLHIHTMTNAILGVPAPTLPEVNAPKELYEKQLNKVLTVASEVNPDQVLTGKRFPIRVQEVRTKESDERRARLEVDKLLREAGVRETLIEYDEDSVRYCVECKVSFVEFPVFFPYEGTELGAYAKRHGYFDGDYNKLPASYQTKSPLDCYSDEDKEVQQNLALLGTISAFFAGSFNPLLNKMAKPFSEVAIRVLSRLPFTEAFVYAYSVTKNYMQVKRIYQLPFKPTERLRDLTTNLKLDWRKQTEKAEAVRTADGYRFRGDRPGGQTLGGPPST
jgi:radical SAM superfamily enzyme YgiQ (UPF0313 family)